MLSLNFRQELETHKITNHESVQPERGHQALGNQRLDVLARSLKKCPICSFPVQSGKEFHSHVNTEHLDVISSQWKKCQKCSQFFPSGLILKNHQVSISSTSFKQLLRAEIPKSLKITDNSTEFLRFRDLPTLKLHVEH